MKTNTLNLLKFICFSFIILSTSCAKTQQVEPYAKPRFLQFINEKYGFSFFYPSEWTETTRDLPDKWALVDSKKNTILFIVNTPIITNLSILGQIHALEDIFPKNVNPRVIQEEANKIGNIVKLVSYNNLTLYTYAIKFSDKNVNSIVAGTLCNDKEIMLVLVAETESFEEKKKVYSNILETFKC